MAKRQFLKVFGYAFLILSILASLSACSNKLKRNEDLQYAYSNNKVPPNTGVTDIEGLDFIQLHNYVIDGLMSEDTPFFYIINGTVFITGDNDKKEIKVACVAADKTIKEEIDLFLSMVLRLIGEAAAEQDYKYKAPEVDNKDRYTYTSFGTVFDTYNLSFDCKTQNGEILRNDYIKAGSKIPIDPRYWRE